MDPVLLQVETKALGDTYTVRLELVPVLFL